MNPESSGPTPLNPRGGRGRPEPSDEAEPTGPPAPHQQRSESSISDEAQAVRTLASAHRLAGEIENEARRRADEIKARAELEASRTEHHSRARAEALIAEATAERDRIWEQIRVAVGRATSQVGDLLRIREELRLDLREAMRDSSDAIRRLEEGGTGEPAVPPAPPPWLPGGPAELPATPSAPTPPPSASIQGRASEVAGRGSPLSPSTGGAVPGPAPDVAPARPEAATPPLASLRAGPFESFLAVMRFERALAALPAIDAVYVRRFSNGEVDVEVEPAAGAKLAGALRGLEGARTVKAEGGVIRIEMQPEATE